MSFLSLEGALKYLAALMVLGAAVCFGIGLLWKDVEAIEWSGGLLSLVGAVYAFINLRRPRQVASAAKDLRNLANLASTHLSERRIQGVIEKREKDGLAEALIWSAAGGALGAFGGLIVRLAETLPSSS